MANRPQTSFHATAAGYLAPLKSTHALDTELSPQAVELGLEESPPGGPELEAVIADLGVVHVVLSLNSLAKITGQRSTGIMYSS